MNRRDFFTNIKTGTKDCAKAALSTLFAIVSNSEEKLEKTAQKLESEKPITRRNFLRLKK